jgi:hypothetical protein
MAQVAASHSAALSPLRSLMAMAWSMAAEFRSATKSAFRWPMVSA